jgi:subfamily B ATP-binding cassette protein MsbA
VIEVVAPHHRGAAVVRARPDQGRRSQAGRFRQLRGALLLLLEPVKRLVGIHNIFEQALGASQKVFEYLDHIEEIAEKPGATRWSRFSRPSSSRTSPSTTGGARRLPHSGAQPGSEGRRSGGPGGAERRRQDHLANLVPRFYDVTEGASASTAATCASWTWPACARTSASWRRTRSCSTTRWRNNIAYGRGRTPPEADPRAPPKWPWRTTSSSACPRATTP